MTVGTASVKGNMQKSEKDKETGDKLMLLLVRLPFSLISLCFIAASD